MSKIDATLCKRCGVRTESNNPVLVHMSRYTEKVIHGADGKQHPEHMYMVDKTAHLCDNCAKKLESFLAGDEDRVVNDALRKLLVEKLEPAAQCKGHEEDALDMFMEVVRELRQQLNCYPEWEDDVIKKYGYTL